MQAPISRSLAGGTAVAYSHRRPEGGGNNEDAALLIAIDDERAVVAVADGVGGHRDGDQASKLAVETIAECVLDALKDNILPRAAILNGFEIANERIMALGTGAATTLAVVEVEGSKVRPYHVGDSPVLVVGQRGRVKLQTIPHSPVGYLLEAGMIGEEDAMHHVDRHVVSNVVGTATMRIDVGPVLELDMYDTVVLGSDGLFDNLHVEEIVSAIRKGPLEEAGAKLALDAGRRMRAPEAGAPSKADDLTFVLLRRPLEDESGDRG